MIVGQRGCSSASQPLNECEPQQVVVADTDDEAWAATRAAHADWYRSIMKLWHNHDDHTYDVFFAWEPSLRDETIIFGSPARVREQLARLLEVSGCNYVIGAFAWGTLSHAQALHSLRLFTEEVMPGVLVREPEAGAEGVFAEAIVHIRSEDARTRHSPHATTRRHMGSAIANMGPCLT
jgi:hypothetical protein